MKKYFVDKLVNPVRGGNCTGSFRSIIKRAEWD